MSTTTSTQTASMSCPSGGTFYACGEGSRFVGCCNANPCSNGCSDGNLLPASFTNSSQYGTSQLPDQECTDGTKRFYTCLASKFWGCCSVNACDDQAGGCPEENLIAQDLSGNEVLARPYLLGYNSSYVTSTSTSDSATPTASSTSKQSSINAGAIAGGVVGGLAVLAALIFGLVWLLRRRRNSIASQGQPEAQQQPGTSVEGTTKQDTRGYYHQPNSPISSPQPPYSPAPPSYISSETRYISHELPSMDTVGRYEMESGQRYHPYRQA